MNPKDRKPKPGGAFSSIAWSGVILCLLVSNSREVEQRALLTPKITPPEQRLEGVQVSGLEGWVVVSRKVMRACFDPISIPINALNPNAAPLKPIDGYALPQNVTFIVGEMKRLLGGDTLGAALAADSEQVGNEPTKSRKEQPPQSVLRQVDHITLVLVLIGGGYGFLLMLRDWWRLMTPNDTDQRPRASDNRLPTATLSRGSLHPACWTMSLSFDISSHQQAHPIHNGHHAVEILL